MRKTLMVVLVATLLSAGFAYGENAGLKSLGMEVGKEAGKSVTAGAKEDLLNAATKKLKKVQNDKGPIKFKTGTADIDPACNKTMLALAAVMTDYPGVHVQVDGHTDNIGSAETNMKLSQDRAEAVVKYLVEKNNVDSKRLSAKGFGDTKPIADNKTKKGQAKNRRVDFTVTKL